MNPPKERPGPLYRAVDTVAAIDLDRHGLIEASAGTGKTYTIEHLVLRLLIERAELQLEEILLVTYTEKAAGELKVRIRQKIEEALDRRDLTGAQRDKLGAALDNFDTAAIQTIHGFCHGVLSDYAFEHRMPFETEVVDERPIYAEAMHDLLRRQWPAVHGDDLQLLLQLAGFGAGEAGFSDRIIRLAANQYRPQLGDRLLPSGSGADVPDLLSRAKAALEALWTELRPVDSLLEGYAQLRFNARARKKRLEDILKPLTVLAGATASAVADLSDFADGFQHLQRVKSGEQQGIDALMPVKWLKAGPNLEVCPRLEAVMVHLRILEEIFGELQYRLPVEAVNALQAQVPRLKTQKGWISYNDMLTRVADALTGPGGGRLTDILRRRFRVAFVDEFQDTDPVQWRIFAHLFLEEALPPAGAGQLFLIGDPKQAIYAFRGADVFAYLSARQKMETLARQGVAGLYCLATNWRSSPELVAAFNRLFGQPLWFPPAGTGGPLSIGHQPVLAPPPEQVPLVLSQDNSNRGGLNLIDLNAERQLKRAKLRLPALIAAEIQHLVAGSRLRFGPSAAGPEGHRRLGYGDICILIRSRSEAHPLERELQRRRVPYAHYKKPGLFQSADARHLSRVLHAVAAPPSRGRVNAALLTPFFDYTPLTLAGDTTRADTAGLADNHPVRRMLERWRELALSRRWSRLFDAVFNESGVRFRQAATAGWDRFESNCSQLRTYLQQAAYEKHLDLRGLTALLDMLIAEAHPAEGDADLHQIDTEVPKVQLMTMHVSKGLQFPVVFLAGGLTQASHSGMTVYHQLEVQPDAQTITKVIDLSGQSGRERHRLEALEEDKRLLYVALTRAQLKLYLPLHQPEKMMPSVGPVGRILTPALAASFGAEPGGAGADEEVVRWLTPEQILAEAPAQVADAPPAAGRKDAVSDSDLRLPEQRLYRHRRASVASFTRLHRAVQGAASPAPQPVRFTAAGDGFQEGDGGAADELHWRIADGGEDDTGPEPERHPADRLPGGARMGSLLHDLLEQIDYAAVRRAAGPGELDADCTALVRELMVRHEVDAVWQADLSALVWIALCTPVPCAGGRLVLGDLPPQARLHEPEFYCHLGVPEPTAASPGDRYLRGYVDLLFHHGGRYYILDWKSNRLEEGYAPDALAASMAAADYHLQYRIYTLATLRWLKLTLGAGFDAAAHFGGVYYIYLRGLGRGPDSGVFFASPEEIGPLAVLETELGRQLEACHED